MTHRSVTVFLILAAVSAKIYKKCDLAKELKHKYEIDLREIPVWVCIAKHESDFNTSAVNRGSGDHGLFQISDLYWCDTERQGRACSAHCKHFEDDDISDDVRCIKTIYEEHEKISGNGFDAWVVYPHFCKDKDASYLDDCFDTEKQNISLKFGKEGENVGTGKINKTPISTASNEGTTVNSVKSTAQVSDYILNQKNADYRNTFHRVFTSLGYYVLETTTSRNLLKLETPKAPNFPFTSLLPKFTPSIFISPSPSTTVKYTPSNNKSRKNFSVIREEKTVKLQSTSDVFNRVPPLRNVPSRYKTSKNTTSSHRENKSRKFSFQENRLSRKISQDEEVQEIKIEKMYSFLRTKGGGFQLRLI